MKLISRGLELTVPTGDVLHVGGFDGLPIFMAQEILKQNLDRNRQTGQVAQGVQAVDSIGQVADTKGRSGAEGIRIGHAVAPSPR